MPETPEGSTPPAGTMVTLVGSRIWPLSVAQETAPNTAMARSARLLTEREKPLVGWYAIVDCRKMGYSASEARPGLI